MKKKGGGSGQRELRTRLKTARGRKLSSQRWLERQLNDPYVARSKREGFRSRAAYKLIEIDDRFGLLKPGARVVDLGAAPGGWSQVAAERVGSTDAAPLVVAIDYLEHGCAPRRRRAPEGFPRRRRAEADQPGARRREGGRRPLRHGGADDRPPRDRPLAHRRALRGRRRLRTRRAEAGRRLPCQGLSRRHREQAARRPEARLRQGAARQAAGEPLRQPGALSASRHSGLSRSPQSPTRVSRARA